MRIHVTARHCELDPEDRILAEQRLSKLSRFARDIQEAHVIVTGEKYRHTAEITLRLRGQEVASREEADGPRTAIDRAADRIEKQIRRLKERRLERRRGDRSRTADGLAPASEDDAGTWDGLDGAASEE
jgi:putative sigma-54 modulation protein